MSIYEYLERLDADPFDPALTALFLGKDAGPARQRQENGPSQDGSVSDKKRMCGESGKEHVRNHKVST